MLSISAPIGIAQQQPAITNAKLGVPRELVGAFIVVIDDESDVREGMESMLSAWQ